MGIGNARSIASIASIASRGRLLEQPATARRILLRKYILRQMVMFALRWLTAFSSGEAPDSITTRLDVDKPRLHPKAEQATFEQLFARYHRPLLEYLYGITRDRALAEDLVQETFLRAYAAETKLPGVTNPQAWLYRIATNVALDTSRRKRHFNWLPLHRVEPEAGPNDAGSWSDPLLLPPTLGQEDFVASIAERDCVLRVLAELPPRWRAVLLLQTTGGFGARDIGVLLHLEEGNVRKILFRAKERFRAIYTAQGAGEAQGGQP
jgi:RNA polymerase sigma-70 factor (ECF subfamily)